MCTTYLGHFDKTRSNLVPVSLILKRGPFFRVSMATVVTKVGMPLKQFDGSSPCPNPFVF